CLNRTLGFAREKLNAAFAVLKDEILDVQVPRSGETELLNSIYAITQGNVVGNDRPIIDDVPGRVSGANYDACGDIAEHGIVSHDDACGCVPQLNADEAIVKNYVVINPASGIRVVYPHSMPTGTSR